MNSVNFNGIYNVILGNRAILEFASKRNAKYFLAETNRFLDKALIEMNCLFSEVFAEYRTTWLVTLNFKTGMIVNKRTEEEKLQRLMIEVIDQFNRVGNTALGTGSAAWSFIHLKKIGSILLEAAVIIYELLKNKNLTLHYHTVEILKDRIELALDKFQNILLLSLLLP